MFLYNLGLISQFFISVVLFISSNLVHTETALVPFQHRVHYGKKLKQFSPVITATYFRGENKGCSKCPEYGLSDLNQERTSNCSIHTKNNFNIQSCFHLQIEGFHKHELLSISLYFQEMCHNTVMSYFNKTYWKNTNI